LNWKVCSSIVRKFVAVSHINGEIADDYLSSGKLDSYIRPVGYKSIKSLVDLKMFLSLKGISNDEYTEFL